MSFSKEQAIIQAMLFATGREVSKKEIMNVLEIGEDDIEKIIENMRVMLEEQNSSLEIIKVEDSYQMCTKKEYYEYIYPLIDSRSKPNISNAALETLSIIAYNPKITRSEIEAIRGVSSDGTVYKLLEYNLIEEAGRLDAPGRPTTYKVTTNFMKMFGISSLDELPDLPRYKLDENEQIVLDDFSSNDEERKETVSTESEEDVEKDISHEAPMPARDDLVNEEKKEASDLNAKD